MSENKLTIFGDRLLVEPITVTKSIIHVTDSHRWRYKVLAVGAGRLTDFGAVIIPEVAVGDTIIVNPAAVESVDANDISIKVVRWFDVIAKE